MSSRSSEKTSALAAVSPSSGTRLFRSRIWFASLLTVMGMVLLFSLFFSASIGVAGGNPATLIETVLHPSEPSSVGSIMIEMRLPRSLAACLTGMAFALAGGIMQGITRNPLADAGLLGINAGAGFLVVLAAVLLPSLSNTGVMFAAFAGAALAVLLVFSIGMSKESSGPIRLILAGSAVSALLISLSQALTLVFGLAKSLSFWIAGSLSGITWTSLYMTTPWIVVAGLVGLALSGRLSILALGEESAAGLGVNVGLIRLLGGVTVLVLAGASVSLVGGISFLGLIVPHSARFLVGEDYRRLLPVTVLLGGILLVLSDVAARTINAPFDTPVGALVSVIGVPFFMILTYRKRGMY